MPPLAGAATRADHTKFYAHARAASTHAGRARPTGSPHQWRLLTQCLNQARSRTCAWHHD
eukprot:6634949-Pyramimonas_sp.AAC.1